MSQATEQAAIGQVIAGRWKIVAVLRPTAQGPLYQVEDVQDGRPAELELWEERHAKGPGHLSQLEREARVVSRLRHPRLLALIDFGVHERRPFLVTEPASGKPLAEELGSPTMTVPRALAIGTQIVEGLAHAHAHGAVHRAIAPETVWLSEALGGEAVKLRPPRVGSPAARGAKSAHKPALCDPPEQSERGRADHRGDLYAAGVLLYVMCTGREPPEAARSAVDPSVALAEARRESPDRTTSARLDRLLLRAVARSPEARFQSAEELLTALQALGARPAVTHRRPATPARFPLRWVTVGGVALACLAVLLLTTLGRRSDRPTRQTTVTSGAPSIPSPKPPGTMPSTQAGPEQSPSTPIPPATAARQLLAADEAARLPDAAAPDAGQAAPPSARIRVAPAPSLAAPQAPVAAHASVAGGPISGVPSESERAEIWALLDGKRSDIVGPRLIALITRHPEAAWPHLALGDLYFQRRWRRDCVAQWELALQRAPQLRHDPRLAARLCFMLDARWEAAGARRLLDRMGPEAGPILDRCILSAKNPAVAAAAARARQRIRESSASRP